MAILKPYLSFFHPVAMSIVAMIALYTMYLGMQVRRTRLADSDLKKELVKGQFALRHRQMGFILLVLTVIGAIGGVTVAYLNNGKIVIGSHLFVGLGIVGLVFVSAALVPLMQKQDGLRSIHASLNLILLGLFGWQAVTGIQIVQKMLNQM